MRCACLRPRTWLAAAAAVALLTMLSPADARPVRTGRYVEIPYGVSADHPWATQAGSAHRNGRAHGEAPSTLPSLAWQSRLGIGRLSAPAVTQEGDIYVPGAAGLAALDTGGGVRWNVRLGYVTATPSITPTGDLAVGTNGGALVQLSPEGDVLGRAVVGAQVRHAPLVLADGSMVVASVQQAVFRFDAEGRRLFRVPLDGQVSSPPAWSRNGEILVPVRQRLWVLSPRGDVRAQVPVGANVVAGPAVADDGTIWLVTDDAVLHQISSRLEVRSRTELGGRVTVATGIAVGRDGAVRVPLRDGALVCVGPSGTERWRVEGQRGFLGSLAVDRNDVTLVVSVGAELLAVDPDGNLLWSVETRQRTEDPPVLGPDGTIYLATNRGMVQAWR